MGFKQSLTARVASLWLLPVVRTVAFLLPTACFHIKVLTDYLWVLLGVTHLGKNEECQPIHVQVP